MEGKPTEQEIYIPGDIARFNEMGLLDELLRDRTTGNNIIWGTTSYKQFNKASEITSDAIAGEYADFIRRRAQKDKDEKSALTRSHAEVFTPAWIVKFMVDEADEAWRESQRRKSLSDGWQSYVASNRLEITCGEAPYLVNRYDAADGSVTPIEKRAGILSRKLALVNNNVETREEWVKWAKTALQSIYGYEFQGDNLLIARINVLCTMEDYARVSSWGQALLPLASSNGSHEEPGNSLGMGLGCGQPFSPLASSCENCGGDIPQFSCSTESGFEGCPHLFTSDEYAEFASIISWNLWQMDGLTY